MKGGALAAPGLMIPWVFRSLTMSSVMAEGPKNVEGGALARSLFGAIIVVSVLEAWERRKLREVDEQRQGRFGRKARHKQG